MKALETCRECLGALERKISSWKHLSKKEMREVARDLKIKCVRNEGGGAPPLYRWSSNRSLHKRCQKNLKEEVIFHLAWLTKQNKLN